MDFLMDARTWAGICAAAFILYVAAAVFFTCRIAEFRHTSSDFDVNYAQTLQPRRHRVACVFGALCSLTGLVLSLMVMFDAFTS